jgi:predicted regulator of Ras-like GTPase activity (Roadblock/LC7/MglB family)
MTNDVRDDADGHDLDLLITNFIDRIPGATSAVVVTSDGLVLALSEHIARDSADQLAAVASGLASLTVGAATCFRAGQVRQVIVEMDGGYLFVTTVSDGSALAVMCDPACDIGLIGYEMSLIVVRLGQVLTPALIAERHQNHHYALESLET